MPKFVAILGYTPLFPSCPPLMGPETPLAKEQGSLDKF